MSQAETFVSQFCQWARKGNLPASSCRKLPSALRRVLNRDIPAQNGSYQVVLRELRHSGGLKLSLYGDETWVAPTGNDTLLSATIGPYWDTRFSDIRDESVRNNISWFFHYAQQYVYRSRVVNALGAIGFVYGRPCDFFSNHMNVLRIAKDRFRYKNPTEALAVQATAQKVALSTSPRSPRERLLTAWFNGLNSLDPYIHRMVFQYIRALRLAQKEFFEEAVTALDNTVDVAGQFARDRLKIVMNDQRHALSVAYGLTNGDGEALGMLYDQRCFFGAHPSRSKWWDYSEIYADEDIALFFDVVKRLVWKVCQVEAHMRVVEKNPSDWAAWFNRHALMLWDAVWFEHVPNSPYFF